jgi:hypothetical protein
VSADKHQSQTGRPSIISYACKHPLKKEKTLQAAKSLPTLLNENEPLVFLYCHNNKKQDSWLLVVVHLTKPVSIHLIPGRHRLQRTEVNSHFTSALYSLCQCHSNGTTLASVHCPLALKLVSFHLNDDTDKVSRVKKKETAFICLHELFPV